MYRGGRNVIILKQHLLKMHKENLLNDLNRKVDACPFCAASGNRLRHILGGGAVDRPDYFFVLINPTYRNVTSNPDHRGIRIPFMGVSNFWRVLVESGFLPKELYRVTEKKCWEMGDIETVAAALKEARLYLTNLVKCCGADASLPNKERVGFQAKFLMEEIRIVEPKLIVTFGLLPFQTLTGRPIKLSDHLERARCGSLDFYQSVPMVKFSYKVFPTFFPVGRGRPKESVELLKRLRPGRGFS